MVSKPPPGVADYRLLEMRDAFAWFADQMDQYMKHQYMKHQHMK